MPVNKRKMLTHLNLHGEDLFVDSFKTGMIMPFAGEVAPEEWLLCDGQLYPVSEYQDLFDVIGYKFGGSGVEFAVPDLRETVPVGIGQRGGIERHDVYSLGQFKDDVFQSHNHSIDAHCHGLSNHTHLITDHCHSGTVESHCHGLNNHVHPMGQHQHIVTDSGHCHSMNHGHTATDSGHTHPITDHCHTMCHGHPGSTMGDHCHTMSHSHGVTDNGHTHPVTIPTYGVAVSGGDDMIVDAFAGAPATMSGTATNSKSNISIDGSDTANTGGASGTLTIADYNGNTGSVVGAASTSTGCANICVAEITKNTGDSCSNITVGNMCGSNINTGISSTTNTTDVQPSFVGGSMCNNELQTGGPSVSYTEETSLDTNYSGSNDNVTRGKRLGVNYIIKY